MQPGVEEDYRVQGADLGMNEHSSIYTIMTSALAFLPISHSMKSIAWVMATIFMNQCSSVTLFGEVASNPNNSLQ